MDSFLGGTTGASSSFYEVAAKADLSSSRLSMGRSPATSPKVLYTPPVVIPSIFDQISDWFAGIIGRRKIIAAAVSAGTSIVLFFLLTSVLQTSPWRPVGSVYDALALLFSPSAWTAAILVWMGAFMALALVNMTVVKPDTPRRLCLLRKDVWAAAAAYWLSQILLLVASHRMSETEMDSPRWLFSLIAAAAATGHALFRLDYRLVFGTVGSKLSLALWECVAVDGDGPLVQAVRDAASLYRVIGAGVVVGGAALLGPSATLYALLSPSLLLSVVMTTVSVLFVARAHIRITREIVMKPMHFPLPPAFAVRHPTPAQTRTLLNVLEASDEALKLFALTDLARLVRMAGERRLEIFSLSQPGGHPRNWTAVKNSCVAVIDNAREKIECATRALGRTMYPPQEGPALSVPHMLPSDEEAEEEAAAIDRQMLMMPERIRQQVYSTAVRSRHIRSLRAAAALQPRAPLRPTMMERARRFLEVPSGVVSRYDATLVQLAAESLHLLIVASFDEDRYGVVQRDLAAVLRAILRATSVIREHFRVRNARATESEEDAPLCAMDDALHTAVYQIKHQFGDYLKSISLTKEELAAIDMMC